MIKKICIAEDCIRSAERSVSGKRGYCSMHYERVRKHGDPNVVVRTASPAIDWIESNKGHTGATCLVWPFSIGKDGYGRVHRPGSGTLTTASRLMCEAAHGQPPTPEHEAAHSCGKGNAGCVNRCHLYWATPSRNHADKIIHGTTNRGERQGQSKLKGQDVIAIRAAIESGMSQTRVAKMFGVCQPHISDIGNGKRWAWMSET